MISKHPERILVSLRRDELPMDFGNFALLAWSDLSSSLTSNGKNP
jgi:hypothetical protein